MDALPPHDGEWARAGGHWHHSITPLVGASGAGAKSRPIAFAVPADCDQLENGGLLDRSGTSEDAAHASDAIGLDDHCSGYPQFDASLLRSGPPELYVEELAERVLLHLFNSRLASAHLGMLRARLL